MAIKEICLNSNFNLNELIQPLGKECWENAARALSIMRYPRISEIIPGLFRWLQDLNWPGAEIVMELLQSLPRKVIFHRRSYITL